MLPISKITHTYSLKPQLPPAVLVLADGKSFTGFSIGILGSTVGEVVFNTSMTGYQEIFTDPSYTKQIVTLTYPHIGNVGVNNQDDESGKFCLYINGKRGTKMFARLSAVKSAIKKLDREMQFVGQEPEDLDD